MLTCRLQQTLTVLVSTAAAQSAERERLRDVFSWSRGSSQPSGTASLWPSEVKMRLNKYSTLRRVLLAGLKRFLVISRSFSHTIPSRVCMSSASRYILCSSARYLLNLKPQSSLARAAPLSLHPSGLGYGRGSGLRTRLDAIILLGLVGPQSQRNATAVEVAFGNKPGLYKREKERD